MVKIHNIYKLSDRRKELRKNPTPQEEKLWWYLRDERLGVKFRRQHSVSGYILDFFCKEKRLVIELDGEVHESKEAREYDEVRNKFLESLDYKVVRFWNSEIDKDINKVLAKIEMYL